MSRTDVKTAELQGALDWTTTHLDSWDQGAWARLTALAGRTPDSFEPVPSCGADHCLAGNVAILNGFTFVTEPGRLSTDYVVPNERLTGGPLTEDDLLYIADVAAKILGLDQDRAHRLFFAGNRLVELWALAWAYSGGVLTLPETLPQTHDDGRYLNVPGAVLDLFSWNHELKEDVTDEMVELLKAAADKRDIELGRKTPDPELFETS